MLSRAGSGVFTAAKVTLMVKDVEHSVKFYRDDLGLRQTVRYGNEWVELEAPGTVIALHPKPQAQILPTAEDDFDRFPGEGPRRNRGEAQETRGDVQDPG